MAKFNVRITREYMDGTNEPHGSEDTPIGTLIAIAAAVIGIVIFMVTR